MKVWRSRTYQYDPASLTYIYTPTVLQLVVADPQALFHIQAKNVYNYQKTKILRTLFEWTLGRSVAWAEGREHKRMRIALNPCFTFVFLSVLPLECDEN